MRQMRACPKCGGTTGLYSIAWVRQTLRFQWDGEPDGGDLGASNGGNMLYCADCDKPVMRASTFNKLRDLLGGDA